jgi:perosamine synthetase
VAFLPAELWQHRLSDVLAGAFGLIGANRNEEELEVPGVGASVPIRSARAAIAVALCALGLPKGARIGVPLYSCPAVFKAVKAAGFEMTFVDVDRRTFCMSAKDLRSKRSKIDAIVAIHMFGHMCDMPKILETANGLPIIEDCAQALGSCLEGKHAGTYGRIAAFSFRLGKYISAGEGGALFTKDEKLLERIRGQIKHFDSVSLAAEVKHIGISYTRAMLRSKPLYGLIGQRLWKAYNARVDYVDKTPVVIGRMFKSDIVITRRRLGALKEAMRRQRDSSDYYLSSLKLPSGMLFVENKSEFANRYLFPVALPSQRYRDFISEYLSSRRIGSLKPYADIAEIALRYYGYAGDCPMAEKAAASLLAIPVHHALMESERKRIVEIVNAAWDEACRKFEE